MTATQKGRKIFQMMVSYSKPEPSTLEYQPLMPSVPAPESLKSDEDKLRELLLNPQAKKYHKSIQMRLEQPITIETKSIPLKLMPVDENGKPNRLRMWIRAKGKLPDIAAVHQCVLAYCSDHSLLNAALVPHGLSQMNEQRFKTVKMMASLDHSMWFHDDFRADEWLLYDSTIV